MEEQESFCQPADIELDQFEIFSRLFFSVNDHRKLVFAGVEYPCRDQPEGLFTHNIDLLSRTIGLFTDLEYFFG
jgi:hypothetical protein